MQQHHQQHLPIKIVHTIFALDGAVESANIAQAGALEGALMHCKGWKESHNANT